MEIDCPRYSFLSIFAVQPVEMLDRFKHCEHSDCSSVVSGMLLIHRQRKNTKTNLMWSLGYLWIGKWILVYSSLGLCLDPNVLFYATKTRKCLQTDNKSITDFKIDDWVIWNRHTFDVSLLHRSEMRCELHLIHSFQYSMVFRKRYNNYTVNLNEWDCTVAVQMNPQIIIKEKY